MKIGIVGSGSVGQTLGAGFRERGHDVTLGSRDPSRGEIGAWCQRTGGCAGTFGDAAQFGELVVLATRWSGTEAALRLAGADRLAGKIVMDVTNPLDSSPGAPPRLALGFTDSGGEQVQRWIPDALVVKAFNSVGAPLMVDPALPGGPPDMFLCGNDARAKQVVAALCRDFGWHPNDIGEIDGARLLEPLAMLWITQAMRSGSWAQAFKLLRP